jgi:hypothetical protein
MEPTPIATPILLGSLAESLESTITPGGGEGRDLPRTEDPGVIVASTPVIRPTWWVIPTLAGIALLVYLLLYSTSILLTIYQVFGQFNIQTKGVGEWVNHLNLASPADRAILLPELALSVGGITSDLANTPRERFHRWQNLFPQLRQEVELLSREYERTLYSAGQQTGHTLQKTSRKIYQFMLPRMIFRRLRMKW